MADRVDDAPRKDHYGAGPVITEAMIAAGDRVVAAMFDGRAVKTADLAVAIYRAMWKAMS